MNSGSVGNSLVKDIFFLHVCLRAVSAFGALLCCARWATMESREQGEHTSPVLLCADMGRHKQREAAEEILVILYSTLMV